MPPDASLCFQKWNVDSDQESKVSRQDDVAIHLLFAEAQFCIDQGKLRPSAEQTVALEALSDPSFPTERQYIELARTLPGYQTHIARGVVVQGDILSNDVQLPEGKTVTCLLEQDKLVLKAAEVRYTPYMARHECVGGYSGVGQLPTLQGEEVTWEWGLVKRWRTCSREELHYEVCMKQANAPILSWIQLQTHQVIVETLTVTNHSTLSTVHHSMSVTHVFHRHII